MQAYGEEGCVATVGRIEWTEGFRGRSGRPRHGDDGTSHPSRWLRAIVDAARRSRQGRGRVDYPPEHVDGGGCENEPSQIKRPMVQTMAQNPPGSRPPGRD